MTKGQKITLVVLALIASLYIKFALFSGEDKSVLTPNEPDVTGTEEVSDVKNEEVKPKVYVNIFLIGQNQAKEEYFKAIKREYPADGNVSKINFAINQLVNGPVAKERNKGLYTEIPTGTKVLGITENSDKVIIDLNSAFVNGGGTEGLYKRLYQLIKTANKNTTLPVYLYIDGKQADVIGGEGIMLKQPLTERSFDE